ncbi:MAG: terminase gpA endonuclease subunit, partial [Candidatus Latescibacterota bacterium]
MKIQEAGAGYMHFSDELNEEYFRQLTAEKVMTRFHKGFKRRVFEKIRPRNEALDCMVYALAAYGILGVDVNSFADRAVAKEEKPVEEPKKTAKNTFIPRTGRGFTNSWR